MAPSTAAGIDTVEGQLTRDANLDPDRLEIDGTAHSLTNIERGFLFWQAVSTTGGTVDARDWTYRLRWENWSKKKVTFLGGKGREIAVGGGGPRHPEGARRQRSAAGWCGERPAGRRQGPGYLQGRAGHGHDHRLRAAAAG